MADADARFAFHDYECAGQKVSAAQLAKADFRDPVVVLGYWRCGATLRRELMCLDLRDTFPTTHACMNPHHFLLTEASVLASGGASAQCPVDEMVVHSGSPKEDEFGLLSWSALALGSASDPFRFMRSLKAQRPCELSPEDEQRWRQILGHLSAAVPVHIVGGRVKQRDRMKVLPQQRHIPLAFRSE